MPGGIITPSISNCFEITFDLARLETTFVVEAGIVPRVAIFAQHVPTEFERSKHYLYDAAKVNIEPAFVEGSDKPRLWGEAMGAAILVNIITFTGVLLLVPVCSRLFARYEIAFSVVANAFASGALLACAVFLILMESTHLVTAPTEAAQAAMWGAMVIAGFLTSPFLDTVAAVVMWRQPDMPVIESTATTTANASAISSRSAAEAAEGAKEVATKEGTSTDIESIEVRTEASASDRTRVLISVLVGDFMHNLCDGIFIGVAFVGCGSTLGWSVTAGTVYHEFAQELADFVVLTDPQQGRLTPRVALLLNFLSGISVVLGTAIIMAQDTIDDQTTGLILAYSGGVYVNIATTECMSKALKLATGAALKLASFTAFMIGGTAIGLVLFEHKHCAAGGHAHAH